MGTIQPLGYENDRCLPNKIKKDIAELHQRACAAAISNGMSRQEASATFGRGRPWVDGVCTKYGIRTRGRMTARMIENVKSNPRTFTILAALIDAKENDKEIAIRFGVTKQRVGAIRKQATDCGVFVAVSQQRRWRNIHSEQWRIENPFPRETKDEVGE